MARDSSLSRQNDGPITKVNKGNIGKALRLYVPREVAVALNLQSGDSVRWTVVHEDGKPVAKFRKVRVELIVKDA